MPITEAKAKSISKRHILGDIGGSASGGAGGTAIVTKVKVSDDDTTPDYLSSKITAGTGITLSVQNAGADEELQISGSQIQYFAESRSIAVPNATIPAHKWAVTGAETNIDIVLSPKGTGAILAQTPDNTITGGNKRGTYAVDLQRVRNNASQIATGDWCFLGGGKNNKCLSSTNIICGGDGNVTSDGGSVVCGGSNNQSLGGCSFVGAGAYNVIAASNSYSVICAGNGNQMPTSAQRRYAFIGGGLSNILTGDYSVIAGGAGNKTLSYYCGILSGYYALTNKYGQQAHAAGRFSNDGDAQRSRLVARNKYNNTSGMPYDLELFLDGSSARILIPNYSTWTFKIYITGHRIGYWSDGHCTFAYGGGIKKQGTNASTALIYGVTDLAGERARHQILEGDTIGTTTLWSLESSGASTITPPRITADTTNGALKITCYVPNGSNMQYVAEIELIETYSSS